MKLLEKLKNYKKKNVVSLHMPGHKGKKICKDLPYDLDITEIDGFDNLQNPKGILKDCLERASKVFSSYKTFYSINGGTCGCLSALATYCDLGDKIIVATNCHKSIYNFIEMFDLKAVYVTPKYDEFGLAKSFCASDFESVVKSNLDAKAVVLTSPTYEGVISDIKDISQFLHEKNLPLIVDEAHGSHLFLVGKSAINCGADIVLNSCHKTLPALTQTALIHVGKNALNKENVAKKLQDKLNKFQSSSPSYILMASIDKCVDYVASKGKKARAELANNLDYFKEKSKKLKYIKILNYNVDGKYFDFDMTKIVLFSPFVTGVQLMSMLREKGFELEMSYNRYCLAMTTIMDNKRTFEKFMQALILLEKEIEKLANLEIENKLNCKELGNATFEKGDDLKNIEKNKKVANFSYKRDFLMTIHEAQKEIGDWCDIFESVGKISKEYIYAYPPGSPILIPGEKISRDFILLLKVLQDNGTQLCSTTGKIENHEILCVASK